MRSEFKKNPQATLYQTLEQNPASNEFMRHPFKITIWLAKLFQLLPSILLAAIMLLNTESPFLILSFHTSI